MVTSQPAGVGAAVNLSSPPRSSTTAHPAASSFISRLPVPRKRCQVSLANKENEQLQAPSTAPTSATATAACKLHSPLPTRTTRQALAVLPASDTNVTAAHRVTAATSAHDQAAAVVAVPEQPRPLPRARRQWVKSTDVWPALIPALQQHSPSSAVSDGSASSDEALNTPDRSDSRLPAFDSRLADSPVDVKADTIRALHSSITDMRAQHAVERAERDAGMQAVADELRQCKAELTSALADATRAQQQLASSEAQLLAVQAQLAESEARWRTAELRVMEGKRRDSEMRELKKRLAAVSRQLSAAREAQETTMSELSEGPCTVEAVRLPVLVGDCIKRHRKVSHVG